MTRSTCRAVLTGKVRLILSAVFLCCILLMLLSSTAYAEGDGYELIIELSYTEVDAAGKTLRDTYDLIRDGVFPSGSGLFDYEVNIEATIMRPDTGRQTYALAGYAGDSDRAVRGLTVYDASPQTGEYSLYSCTVPDGYEFALPPNDFRLSQQDVDTIKSGGTVTKYIDIEIVKKAGTPEPAPEQEPAPASAPAPALTAKPTASVVLVNGAQTAFDAYNIDGSNYFKLRVLA